MAATERDSQRGGWGYLSTHLIFCKDSGEVPTIISHVRSKNCVNTQIWRHHVLPPVRITKPYDRICERHQNKVHQQAHHLHFLDMYINYYEGHEEKGDREELLLWQNAISLTEEKHLILFGQLNECQPLIYVWTDVRGHHVSLPLGDFHTWRSHRRGEGDRKIFNICGQSVDTFGRQRRGRGPKKPIIMWK